MTHSPSSSALGTVWLIGAGPGDPELLTLKAARLLAQADAVVYDRLVNDAILAMAPATAVRIYAGKQRSNHHLPQQDINQLLVDLAREHKVVVRLKGGDPFVFGRGGEELETLAAAGVPFGVVPGITAATGCAAYAGIPLTHRDYAQSVRFITGHNQAGETNIHWPELMAADQTLVFYMGLGGMREICTQLIARGRDPHTPLALIENGTLPEQQTYTATLATIDALLADNAIQSPTLAIIGPVVALHSTLNWLPKDVR